jgi:hypothetical protein
LHYRYVISIVSYKAGGYPCLFHTKTRISKEVGQKATHLIMAEITCFHDFIMSLPRQMPMGGFCLCALQDAQTRRCMSSIDLGITDILTISDNRCYESYDISFVEKGLRIQGSTWKILEYFLVLEHNEQSRT